jgi:DNA-binding MarR family transcriptional regulator
MIEVDVKQAFAVLYGSGSTTQAELAAELGCTQPNVYYHLNNTAKQSRAPAALVERIKVALKRRNLEVPMCEVAGGAA